MTQILRWGLILFCSSLLYRSSKITPSLFTIKEFFSKITPSLFTIKEGSTSHPDPLSSGAREETALLGARNRCALRLAGHQSPRHGCAGWDRRGTDCFRPSPGCAGWDRWGVTCHYLAIVCYILLKVVGTTPILKPPCFVINHKENAMSLMYKDESSSHHKLSSYPYPRKTFHNAH